MTDILRDRAKLADGSQQHFEELARQWRMNTMFLSDSALIAQDENYQAIIAMGKQAITPMLRDLQSANPGHWFAALQKITGENPVNPADAGHIDRMAAAWIQWGKQRGYLS